MLYKIIYAEYMEYEEDVEASTPEEAKRQFEQAVEDGQVEPLEARIIQYKVEAKV